MASIRRTPGASSWQVRYRSPDGRQRNRNFKKHADAEKFAVTVEASKLRGEYIDPTLAKTKFSDWAARWLETKIHLKPKTRIG